MRKYGFENGHGASFQYNLRFLEFPVFKYGKQVVELVEVPGRAGTVTIKKKQYTDTTISMTVEFGTETVDEFEEESAKIRDWIMSSDRLSFTDMEGKYFLVKKVNISGEEREYGLFGKMSIEFTCDPSVYFDSGNDETEQKTLVNPYSWSQPIYKIYGEGMCTLTVNGNSVEINISDNAIIDTEKMITYREDGTIKNTSMTGDYEDLYLQNGENEISVTENFELKIIPRWRRLL